METATIASPGRTPARVVTLVDYDRAPAQPLVAKGEARGIRAVASVELIAFSYAFRGYKLGG